MIIPFWLAGKIWRMAGSCYCCTGLPPGQGNPFQINARDGLGLWPFDRFLAAGQERERGEGFSMTGW
ncbi:hypothetical protein CDV52_20065 [Haematobacter missouriensis]|uniref:Uncharacterized protein n=1 Tax=Haematobacter missouriensis TaxID=366616 RepID=A0A212AHN6_9RHOB|nr:hypothetical protein CDV52_20065 [Haematobacter missouriensis]